jgi:hypothetical protein
MDPLEASSWIGTLAEGADRDAAVEALLHDVAATDPDAAAAWASTLSDERRREEWSRRLQQ